MESSEQCRAFRSVRVGSSAWYVLGAWRSAEFEPNHGPRYFRPVMPRLSNRKHEAFAREVAAMTPLPRAYAAAGFAGNPKWHPYNASKLVHKPHVRARIDELCAQFAEMSGIHAEYIQRKLLPLIEANAADLF